MPYITRQKDVNRMFPTKQDGDVYVLGIENKTHYRIIFLEFPYETIVRADILFAGNIKNYMKPSVYNIGYVGVGPHLTSINHKCTSIYKTWNSMLGRCYAPIHKNHVLNYADVTVDPHWFNFQNFATWYESQPLRDAKVSFNWELDKDLLYPGNRQYGPNTCCLIPQPINSLFGDAKRGRGRLPMGVSDTRGRFQARVSAFGKSQDCGCYKTIREAQFAYWSAKFDVIRDTAIQYWNYLPEPLAFRLLNFDWPDAVAYYGDDARLWD